MINTTLHLGRHELDAASSTHGVNTCWTASMRSPPKVFKRLDHAHSDFLMFSNEVWRRIWLNSVDESFKHDIPRCTGSDGISLIETRSVVSSARCLRNKPMVRAEGRR